MKKNAAALAEEQRARQREVAKKIMRSPKT